MYDVVFPDCLYYGLKALLFNEGFRGLNSFNNARSIAKTNKNLMLLRQAINENRLSNKKVAGKRVRDKVV